MKAPALVGTISPVKQQTMDGLSPNHQYQQLYSSGNLYLQGFEVWWLNNHATYQRRIFCWFKMVINFISLEYEPLH